MAYTCAYKKDRTIITIRALLDREVEWRCPKLKSRLNLPLVIDVDSPGGWVLSIEKTIQEVWQLAFASAYFSHTTPLVHVHGTCASACIGLLAGLNQMAKSQTIQLAVDPDTKLGFHGASVNGKYHALSTMYYRLILSQTGVDLNWLRANENLFESLKVKDFLPDDKIFAGSNILTFANISGAREVVQHFPGVLAKAEAN